MSHKTAKQKKHQSGAQLKKLKKPKKAAKAIISGIMAERSNGNGNMTKLEAVQHMLQIVADHLNAIDGGAGFAVRLAYDSVITNAGYVFAFNDPDGPKWQVRTPQLTEVMQHADVSAEDD